MLELILIIEKCEAASMYVFYSHRLEGRLIPFHSWLKISKNVNCYRHTRLDGQYTMRDVDTSELKSELLTLAFERDLDAKNVVNIFPVKGPTMT